MVNLLVLAHIVRAQKNAERILADPWEQRFRDTLGKLSKHLKPFLAHDQQLMNDIAEGVRVRNYLGMLTGASMPKTLYPLWGGLR